MAFTRNWDETTPDGAITAAADIDLVFRQLKVDIRERLEDISTFGSDTDPLELLASAVEAQAPLFYGIYDADGGAGTRVSGEGRGKLLVCRISGTTDGIGTISVDVDEFSVSSFDITVIEPLHLGTISSLPSNNPGRIHASGLDDTANTFQFTIYDSTDALVVSTSVEFTAAMLVA